MPLWQNKRILVIIPAYNEADSISGVINELRKNYPEFFLLVIDDCSLDKTAFNAIAAGANVISLPFNLGIGGAVQTGFKFARQRGFDFALQFDGDGQHNSSYIPKILEPVVLGRLNLCIGSRFISRGQGFKSSFLRRFGIRFFALFIGFLTRQRLTDPTSGFRCFDKKMISLFAEYYPVDFPEPESIVVAKLTGAQIGEVAVLMRPRMRGVSSIRFLRSGYYMIKVTLAILIWLFKQKPTHE